MGIMITYHGHPMYNAHQNVGVHYTQQNMVAAIHQLLLDVCVCAGEGGITCLKMWYLCPGQVAVG